MKNLYKVFGLIVLVAIIGFSFAACGGGGGGDDGDGGGGSGGTFTLTDIPAEYNGMYVAFGGENGTITIQGFRDKPGAGGLQLSPIANGKASFPLWVSTQQYGGFTKRYSGNDTLNCELSIWDRDPGNQIGVGRTFSSITFSNGNATRSWNDGY